MDKINNQNSTEIRVIEKRNPVLSLVLNKKKFLINKDFQFQFMLSLMLISIVSMSIIYMANNYFFHSYIQKGEALNLAPDHPFFLMIHEQKKFMTSVFVVVSVCLSTVISLWGLLYSHKIAGPLYRLKRYFAHAAAEGKPLSHKIYFRDDDFFQEVPESINKYIESLNQKNEDNAQDTDEAA